MAGGVGGRGSGCAGIIGTARRQHVDGAAGWSRGRGLPSSRMSKYLSDRELQIVQLLAEGHSDKAIAQSLGMSKWTVRTHMTRMFEKTGQRSRTGLVAMWLRTNSRSVATSSDLNST
jgi:DNA-binding CsgD family transcriptional regulator